MIWNANCSTDWCKETWSPSKGSVLWKVSVWDLLWPQEVFSSPLTACITSTFWIKVLYILLKWSQFLWKEIQHTLFHCLVLRQELPSQGSRGGEWACDSVLVLNAAQRAAPGPLAALAVLTDFWAGKTWMSEESMNCEVGRNSLSSH